jgi:hypothetical protein
MMKVLTREVVENWTVRGSMSKVGISQILILITSYKGYKLPGLSTVQLHFPHFMLYSLGESHYISFFIDE